MVVVGSDVEVLVLEIEPSGKLPSEEDGGSEQEVVFLFVLATVWMWEGWLISYSEGKEVVPEAAFGKG